MGRLSNRQPLRFGGNPPPPAAFNPLPKLAVRIASAKATERHFQSLAEQATDLEQRGKMLSNADYWKRKAEKLLAAQRGPQRTKPRQEELPLWSEEPAKPVKK